VKFDCLREEAKAAKCSAHRTISLIAHTANTVERILRKRIKNKTEDVFEEDQFGFRKRKGARNTIKMLRTKSERRR
jgi:hypothetical protein